MSERTITRRVKRGDLQTIRTGGRVLIEQSALDRFHDAEAEDAAAIERRRHIAALVRKAPPLTAAQAARITAVLKVSA
ncbi:hypothetical protein SCNU_09944 [Gordonia neofelifaecis NRRL B-59395]|uniref:Helix-turn-helix domain-containing protein n=1 Tax=Gordonia neofelifaecis NRRL B-59395 TaxID=644548 RepID=F1YJF2_9ACTN|nr:hypothetical protein SCNU_09944 [Gordonia neofelifaecis NRRL B-59395]